MSDASSDDLGEEDDELNHLNITRESNVGINRLSRVSSQFLPPDSSRKVRVPLGNYELRYSFLSQRGYYPGALDKANQDSFCIHTPFGTSPDDHFFGVFDGHGEYGAQCSQFVKRRLCENLLRDSCFQTDAVLALHSAFVATNSQLHADNLDDSMSGTTAVTILVRGKTMYIANTGDSRAVIAEKRGVNIVAVDLSIDQTPYRFDELERVKECGARVLTLDQIEGLKNADVQCWGTEESDDGDPPRLWVQNGMYPGTAFTRSIGDSVAESIGVVADPEIFILDLNSSHPFFVLASDGVFEFLSSQTVVDMMGSTQTVTKVSLQPSQQVLGLAGSESPLMLSSNTNNQRSRHDLSRARLRALESSLEYGQLWVSPSPSHRKTWEEQGGEGDCFYVVGSGEYEVLAIQEEDGREMTKVLHRYTADKLSSFGELALMHNKPLQASVRAVTSGTLWALKREDFRGILMSEFSNIPSMKLLRSNDDVASLYIIQRGRVRLILAADQMNSYSWDLIRAQTNQVQRTQDDGDYVVQLDEGGHFGEWSLIGETIAFTAISVGDVTCSTIAKEKFDSIVGPLPKLSTSDSRIKESLVSKEHGADDDLPLRSIQLSDLVGASVVDALEKLHQKSILYRGVSADILMLDRSGHLQLVDFRFAKKLEGERTYTICGIADSLAPEIVLGRGHGFAADWWALGVLIYFMLQSDMPFGSWRESELEPFAKFLKGRLIMPSTFSKEVVDLITKVLLMVDENERLGTTGAEAVKKHPWFDGIDWGKIAAGKSAVPKEITDRINGYVESLTEDLAASPSMPSEESDDFTAPEWVQDWKAKILVCRLSAPKGPEGQKSTKFARRRPSSYSPEMAAADDVWCRETVPRVMELVSPRLPQRDACALLVVSPWCYRALVANPKLWEVLDLREMKNAGDRLIAALSLNISDKGLGLIANNYQGLKKLNITRCVKLTDDGLQEVLQKCSSLESLNLYALSSFTDKVYKEMGSLTNLTFLDLCGAQNLTDDGLACISRCRDLTYLNLTWCVRVTDVGVIAVAQCCRSLEFLSLFGIVGVTDACLEALWKSCSRSLTTLDVNGCIGIKRRSRDDLLQLFPLLSCFKVHS
ncbi:hypothetical protein EJB05_24296, partial [Eragrostis curvula]